MGLYLKTRLFEEPFMIQKALTQSNRIQKWLNAQDELAYSETNGYYATHIQGVFIKPSGPVTEKSIPCTLTLVENDNSVQPIVISFNLFYMRSHTQSIRYTDLHVYIEQLPVREDDVKYLMSQLFERLRQHFNGNWIITDQELHSSRLL